MTQQKKIAFALIVHNPHDGVIYHHIVRTLKEDSWEYAILSAKSDNAPVTDKNILIINEDKSQNIRLILLKWLARVRPNYVFCDTPWAVAYLHHLGYKTIYHITEWYPSKKNLRGYPIWYRPIRFVLLAGAFLLACLLCDAIIAGEKYKSALPKKLFPWKPQMLLTYYPSKWWFPIQNIKPLNSDNITFLYAGPATLEKGWYRVTSIVKLLSLKYPQKSFTLKVLSHDYSSIKNESFPGNVHLAITDEVPIAMFCKEILTADICLDLRNIDIENTHCLPIKMFYYMAAGKPMIYSDLKAIRKHFPDVMDFVYLVSPDDLSTIVERIECYMFNPHLYMQHAQKARCAFYTKYNWENIQCSLLDFMQRLIVASN